MVRFVEDFVEDILDVSCYRISKNIARNCLIKSDDYILNTIHEICINEINKSKIVEIFKNNNFYIYFSVYMQDYMFNNFKLMNYLSSTENKKELSFQKSLFKYNNKLIIDDVKKCLENNSIKFSRIIKNREDQNIFLKDTIVKNKSKVFELTSNVYIYTLLKMSNNHISLDFRRKKWAEELLTFSFEFLKECLKDSEFTLKKEGYKDKVLDLYFFERYFNYFFDISCLKCTEHKFGKESLDFKILIANTLLPIVNLPNVFDNGYLIYIVTNYICQNYYENYMLNTRDIHDCIIFYDKIIIPLYNSLFSLILNCMYKDKEKKYFKELINYEKKFINMNSNVIINDDNLFEKNNIFGLIYPNSKELKVKTFTDDIKYKYLTNDPYKDLFFDYIVTKADEKNNYENTTINDLKEYIDKYNNNNKAIYNYDFIMGNDNKKNIENCIRLFLS